MKKVARFERVKYSDVQLPIRTTKGSAGYDFFSPQRRVICPGCVVFFGTDIRVRIKEGYVLQLYPRSSLGIKGLELRNTVGIVDSDYYYSDNNGEIMCTLKNTGTQTIIIEKGERFMQGIFIKFGITVDDKTVEERNGGYGSTGK